MRIPGFEMLEKLGDGGMSTVWKARQISLDRTVAIKIMSSRLASDPADVKMFLHEAQSTAKLKHQGIIQVYDANVLDGVYYYVMEYVAGYTVGDWIRRKGRLPEKDALVVTECVASALEYAWEKERMIHCDIKPDNVIVDSDGTVKVSDLGLSRTLSGMGGGAGLLDDIMGTSAFMSPEQIQGLADLDCRADIYSLGSMLYHMVTGKILFDGHTDDQIMDLQISGTVPDPLELNPELSKATCWLIEKMMMKDRDLRHADWKAVLTDIARAKREIMPAGGAQEPGRSTVERCAKRTPADFEIIASQEEPEKKASPMIAALILAVIAGAAFAGYMLWNDHAKSDSHQTVPAPTPIPVRPPPPPPKADDEAAEKNARDMYDFARKWAAENQGKYDEIVKRFQDVMNQTKGTKYSLMAQDDMERAATARDAAVGTLLKKLESETSNHVMNNEFAQAAKVYDSYSGALAEQSKEKRKAIADKLRKQQHEFDTTKQSQEKEAEQLAARTFDAAIAMMATGSVSDAKAMVADAINNPKLEGKTDVFNGMARLLDSAEELDRRVLNSFRPQQGKTIAVDLQYGGTRNLLITDVSDKKVMATQSLNAKGATTTLSFGISDLTTLERLRRLGSEDTPDVAFVKGVIALNSKAYPPAKKYFGMTDPAVASKLVAYVDEVERKSLNDEAEKYLAMSLKSCGIEVGPYNQQAWLETITSAKLKQNGAAALGEAVASFKSKYGGTAFAGEAEPVLAALEQAAGQEGTEPDKTPPRVPLSTPNDITAIKGNSKAALELFFQKNPLLTEKQVTPQTDVGGKIIGMEVKSKDIENLWPVAAMTDIKWLTCINPEDDPMLLKDLTPLRGLALENLTLQNCKVTDLSPLRQLPLRQLNLEKNTGVKDISALKGMKIEVLNLSGTKVFDLLPLSGMPLKVLKLNETQIKNLAITKGMPLTQLEIANTRAYDFSFLPGFKQLRTLNVSGTQFKNQDIAIVASLPLEELTMQDTGVGDISMLKGMQLKSLDVARTSVRDFTVIKTFPLVHLSVAGTKFIQLDMLKDMDSLTSLWISDTDIGDLSPISGLKLKALGIDNTRVTDLSPLKGMPLEELYCRRTKAKDFSMLAGMPLKKIFVDDSVNKGQLTKLFPKLQFINKTWVGD
jgi:serine/threonine-protein kinase